MRPTIALLALAWTIGCIQKSEEVAAPQAPALPPAHPGPAAPDAPAGNPEDVLVEINAQKLTRGEVDAAVQPQFDMLKARAQPDQYEMIRNQLRRHYVEQHVAQTLLLAEADRQNIALTREDEEQAFGEIRADLLERGMALEQVMKNHPLGEEKMREQILVGYRIKKLVEAQSDDTEVDEEQIAALVDRNGTVREKKRRQIEEIREQLVAGADFADLAGKHSECPSAQRGGDLGEFRRGQMVKPFEEAAFSQTPGEIGPVVETDFGYHIILVKEHAGEGEKREGGVSVPEHVRASHILLKCPQPLSAEEAGERLRRQRAMQAGMQLTRELREKADITYADEVAPMPARAPAPPEEP